MTTFARTGLLVLASTAVGVVCGVAWQRGRMPGQNQTVRGAGKAPSSQEGPVGSGEVGSLRDQLADARAEIQDLKARTQAQIPRSPTAVAELEGQVPALIQKRDGLGLLALMRGLAALGPEGWPGAARVLATICADRGLFDLGSATIESALKGPVRDMLLWAFEHPDLVPQDVREFGLDPLSNDRFRAGPVFARALLKESDERFASDIAFKLLFLARPGLVEDLSKAIDAQVEHQAVLDRLLDTLASCKSPEGDALLQKLTFDARSKVRDSARAAYLVRHPTDRGLLVLETGEKSALCRGDVVLECDGAPCFDEEVFESKLKGAEPNATVSVLLLRAGSRISVLLPGGWQYLRLESVDPALNQK